MKTLTRIEFILAICVKLCIYACDVLVATTATIFITIIKGQTDPQPRGIM